MNWKSYFKALEISYRTEINQELRNAIKEKVSEQDEESCKNECNDSYYVPQTRAFTLVTTNDFSNLYATRPNGTQQRVTEHTWQVRNRL